MVTPSRKRALPLTLLGAVAAVLLTTPPASATIRAEYVTSADAICGKALPSIGRKLDKAIRAADREQINRSVSLFNDALRKWRSMLSDLEDLDRPPEDAATLNRWLVNGRAVVNSFQLAARQLRKGNLLGADRSVVRAGQQDDRADELVADFGFEDCAQ